MLGLPKSTELNKPLAKQTIYKKFNMDKAARDKFDADISRISIVGEINPTNSRIVAGESVYAIFVLLIRLKRKEFDSKVITQMSKLIDQNTLMVLMYEDEYKLAIYHTKLIQSEWKPEADCVVQLNGLTLDHVWENLVVQVGGIEVSEGNTVAEQIAANDQRAKLEKEIARLEKQARAEKQPKKKFEIVQKMNLLKKNLEV